MKTFNFFRSQFLFSNSRVQIIHSQSIKRLIHGLHDWKESLTYFPYHPRSVNYVNKLIITSMFFLVINNVNNYWWCIYNFETSVIYRSRKGDKYCRVRIKGLLKRMNDKDDYNIHNLTFQCHNNHQVQILS